MIVTKQTTQPATHAVVWCVILTTIYIILLFTLPINAITRNLYHLGSLEYRLIMFSAALPSIVVWFAAFIGYDALLKYAHAIRKTPEGKYFKQLATGCTWLVWSLPLTTILALLLNGIANQHPDFHPEATIIINYLNLLLALIAFVVIYRSARHLFTDDKFKAFSYLSARLLAGFFAVCAMYYCIVAIQHLDASRPGGHNPYFLPAWLMFVTIMIPYLFAWLVGLVGTYMLALYGRQTAGLLYRRALSYLVGGLAAVIISSIGLQFTHIIFPRTGHLVLNSRFFIIVLLHILAATGFVCLAIGARRLKRIEEV